MCFSFVCYFVSSSSCTGFCCLALPIYLWRASFWQAYQRATRIFRVVYHCGGICDLQSRICILWWHGRTDILQPKPKFQNIFILAHSTVSQIFRFLINICRMHLNHRPPHFYILFVMSSRISDSCFQCFDCNTNGTHPPLIPGSPIVHMSCHNCHTHWHICVICKSRIKVGSLQTHTTSDEHQLCLDNISPASSNTAQIQPQETHITKFTWDKTLRPPLIDKCDHLPTHSRRFFGLEIQQPGLGMRHIICQAFTGSTDQANMLTQEEIELHLDIIQQCIANSRKSNASFARIIRNITSSLLFNPSRPAIFPQEYHRRVMLSLSSNPDFNASQLQTISNALTQENNRVITKCRIPYSIFRVTRLPTKYSEIRKYYIEGKDAVVPNLPCPKARMLEDGIHAYISPLELVSHYLAWGQGNQTRLLPDPKQSNSVNCYHHSTHAQTITHHINSTINASLELTSFPLILFLTDWQDEFDKNNIIRNKYQIYLRTLTILMQGKRGILEKHTFIVALGSKGDSRYTLDRAYNEDLKKLFRNKKTSKSWQFLLLRLRTELSALECCS